jgi:hypothetical protein
MKHIPGVLAHGLSAHAERVIEISDAITIGMRRATSFKSISQVMISFVGTGSEKALKQFVIC